MDTPKRQAPSEGFLAAVGTLTLNWAAIETALDFMTAIIFHGYKHDKMEPGIPRSLERKLKFLRRGLKHPAFNAFQVRADALLLDILAQRNDRHELVHGALLEDPQGDVVQTLRVKYEPCGHRLSIHTVTTAEVEAGAERARTLSDRSTALAARVLAAARPDELIDYAFGEFAG